MRYHYRDEVPYCASVLDEVKPGWAELIDLDKFDICSPVNCIMGQLYGYPGKFWESLCNIFENEDALGDGMAFSSRNYEHEWREEVLKRTIK